MRDYADNDSILLKHGWCEMLKGGVIMDVKNVEQAKIAEKAGAIGVMILENIPSELRNTDGVARSVDPLKIEEIRKCISINVLAKVRIGHFVEAQILEELKVDMLDESEVLTMADEYNHINKHKFKTPFVCGCTNLGEALRRISEGASMIRTKGEAGTGNIIEAIKHIRTVNNEIKYLCSLDESEVYNFAKKLRAPIDLILLTRKLKRLPVVNFAAGGIATPADAAMCMQLGMDGVFVGSGIFESENPQKMASSIVMAVSNFNNPKILLNVSLGLGKAMHGNTKVSNKWKNKSEEDNS
ncbi:pyridoxine biosynthesis protein PDX1, putative [Plasmodium berghei]|uniref:Pyridoxal 5'-phosphate synthase subunit Pdx1 n=3 Tax=Plasmodium berghei TaxID=5821 RepID=PDX1_PLABE|nr:pyridoxine biosynthesis protein PDX1, putative [Plasmodium berghei ANKA]P0DMS0.1 RecName: Full=Pyridoxal 5'-phosphate synthase subunit Pdx1; Short=PLP synthase subunit Pdx1 [Plasmodium berghei]4ADT_A Chain A, PYRIDOXINE BIOSYNTHETIC ENZYME PDX1 HOMOLOGUE, PUTATIVE [Plasmodium berghei]4ADT_B Chain B, PYRIDOXINE BIOSYNTHETIC ENZYME PDX1 HOMOLOGUE, PUTATIVE [Plasmodium berghei]4ADU_A Chain A, PYRIDOXINE BIOSYNTHETIC ENZYME PDX1 HOMOLOGUE, PUTATIVE [Plasmodium berghei]4ADU_B Chain B, PYRIDOXINE|eukprot:XP_034422409.1 pyridoxine biosynthesis protein PDX1, putative [Plasmodium berghei ANKA]